MLIRQTAPVFGADSSYAQPGEWQLNVSARALRSTDHYNRNIEQVERHTLGTYVINKQRALDLTLAYQATPRWSFAVGVPYIGASWSIPSPRAPVLGPRANEDAHGIGDITASARSWVLDPKTHGGANIGVGVGVKFPTGKSDAQDRFPDISGNDNRDRYVDQSVQPGDGGWGITTELSAFRRIRRVTVFGSGSYLINPRNTNDTPSILVNLGIPNFNLAAPNNVNRLVNSVPDQYLVRAGAAVGVGKGVSASLAWRVEGMPRYDLIGRSDGFRRPGLEMFIEPGISYSSGSSSLSLSVPIGYYRNRKPDAYTGAFGDATFPKYIILGSYSIRFGSALPKGPRFASAGGKGASPDGGAAATLPDPALEPGQALVRLDVAGMTCEHCVETVRAALQGVRGVVDAQVSLSAQQAVVTYDPATVKVGDLLRAVKDAKGMNQYSARVHQR